MSNGDRFYPKQRLADAWSRSKGSGWFGYSTRERVRTGDWPVQAMRSSGTRESDDALREANDRTYRELRWRRMERSMYARNDRRTSRR